MLLWDQDWSLTQQLVLTADPAPGLRNEIGTGSIAFYGQDAGRSNHQNQKVSSFISSDVQKKNVISLYM